MNDPVTGFEYPQEWVDRCSDVALLQEVARGFAVLCSSGKVLRRGFTTGTTAAAASKAAVLSLKGPVDHVEMMLPCGVIANVSVSCEKGRATCLKYPGDYPDDKTAGAMLIATASESEGIRIIPGKGIGRFSRDTPRYPKGAPAISPSAKDLIFKGIADAVKAAGIKGAIVRIEVANGEIIGARTLNRKVGVDGGISLLGTTGLVEPWDDHLEESNLERIANAQKVVLTTGRHGLMYARRLFPEYEAVLVGKRLENAIQAAPGDVVLCGLPALILKFLDPTILDGSKFETIDELHSSREWDGRIKAALEKGKERYPKLHVVIVDKQGTILGDSG